MKNTRIQAKRLGFLAIVLIAVIGFAMIGCKSSDDEDKTLVSIEITTLPTKINYNQGEDLDLTGMVVTATYSDGSKAAVTGYTTSGFDSSTAGQKTITVTYQGKTAEFNVNVNAINQVIPILTFTSAPVLELEPDNAKIIYTWTASNPVADSYDVYWKAGDNLTAAQVKTGTKITGAASGGSITGLTNGTEYSVLVTANKSGYTSINSAVEAAIPVALVYKITGSGASFTATKSGVTVGTADQPIQTVIDAIKTDAAGNACIIEFGDGDTALDIGSTASVSFNNTSGTWGFVELSGKITGSNTTTTTGTIAIVDPVSITSVAEIVNTTTTGIAVYHNSTGTLHITGGKVANTAANATARAIFNNSTGEVKISDGTVQANTGVAVYNANTGKITVSGDAKITSANATTSSGTINIADSGTATEPRLVIEGGTVENTASTASRAVYNDSTGAVNISGGTVKANTGVAVYNVNTGKITVSQPTATTTLITSANTTDASGTIYIASNGTATDPRLVIEGGTVENTNVGTNTARAIYNASTGAVNISGGEVKVDVGMAVYNANTGKITVSGGAKITSSTGTTIRATIYLAAPTSDNTNLRLEISGGTVENIVTNGNARAIYNASTGAVNIFGGVIKVDTGIAVYNNNTGLITVSGTAIVTSKNVTTGTTAGGTIYLAAPTTDNTNPRLVIENGTVENSAGTGGKTIYNASTGAVNISGGIVLTTTSYGVYNGTSGTVNISGGSISATTGYAVYNNAAGQVNISSGTISSEGAATVYNNAAGQVDISGGTVSATTTAAVYNNAAGKITVSQPTAKATLITSASTNDAQGTIYLRSSGVTTDPRLEITGGTVQNTSTAANGNAVYNDSTGAMTMSGGTFSTTATSGRGIFNNSTGALTMTGGTVSVTGTSARAIHNQSTGAITISGGTVSAPVNSTAYAIYKNNASATVNTTGATIIGAVGP